MNTKQIILDSVKRILKNKPIDKITVDMILRESQISRATFYKYFLDKYDTINWIYQEHVDEIINRFDGKNWKELLEQIYSFLKDNHTYFSRIAKDENAPLWKFLHDYSVIFYSGVYRQETGRELDSYIKMELDFNISGALYCLRKWLKSDSDLDSHDMAEITFKYIPKEIQIYL